MEEKTMKEISIEQEERIAALFGGSRTPRSGGGAWKKGDVMSTDTSSSEEDLGWFVECKTSAKPSLSYSVNKSIMDKADHERAEMHKPYYALAFTLGEHREDYFVLDRKMMKTVLDRQTQVNQLIAAVKADLDEIERRRAQMTEGIATLTAAQEASYSAHKAEKLAFLDQLRKLL